jgi:sec-independent protein translocase protein TatC
LVTAMKQDNYVDPDDMFADTRMTFGEHIEDLRTHLMRAIKGFILGMLVSIFLAGPILNFIIAPVDRELEAYYRRFYAKREKELAEEFSMNRGNVPLLVERLMIRWPNREFGPKKVDDEKAVLPELVPAVMDWLKDLGLDDFVNPLIVNAGDWVQADVLRPDIAKSAKNAQELDMLMNKRTLKTLSIQEPLVVYFKIAIMAGFVLSSPWVFYQVWAFIAAGLYPHEKRLVNVYLPFSLFLFLAGCVVCHFFVIPKAIEALFWFNELIGAQPDLRLNEWLGFAIFMPVVFGVSFQTPLVMLFMYMIGLCSIETYRSKRRISIFLMAVFAAVITPSVDAISMMMMWVPMCLLYELGIWMCVYKGREERDVEEMAESSELVEV